ncbi:CDP-alcohol phosphatidyltransferase family protein [Tumebacillus algifaecis]|uniref:CDP-alcohol phosphatidyltransferase family protein n=1 Tax=Tumebacillus algifaecis TaxID=1214604 RepID=UPI0012FE4057|nr:CDP-alcohol phosphatidyltransferase family protein [Tumebacillus algifaecis]
MFKLRDNPYVRYPSPWDAYATLPFAVPISEAFCKTKITPNQITVLSFLIALFAVWCFALGSPWMLVLGGLLYQVSYILDCCDGYVARKTKQSSNFGFWLDHILDELKLALLVLALVYGQQRLGNLDGWLLTASWVMAGLYVYTRAFAKGDLLIKETIERNTAANAAAPVAASDALAEPIIINGMVMTPFQARLYRKFMIVTPFSVIESQAIIFCLLPIVQLPIFGLFITLVITVLWHLLFDVYRYWKRAGWR